MKCQFKNRFERQGTPSTGAQIAIQLAGLVWTLIVPIGNNVFVQSAHEPTALSQGLVVVSPIGDSVVLFWIVIRGQGQKSDTSASPWAVRRLL